MTFQKTKIIIIILHIIAVTITYITVLILIISHCIIYVEAGITGCDALTHPKHDTNLRTED